MASSPFRPGATTEEQLKYYKAQYEQLEVELQEFQASSRELEVELEKDVEASEKRERNLKEQVDNLGYEVEEWKVHIPYHACFPYADNVTDKVQAIQGRGESRAECSSKGDHYHARYQPHAPTQATRYRGRQ